MMRPIQHSKRGILGTNFSKKYIVFLVTVVVILVFSFFNSARGLVGSALAPFFKTGNFFYDNFGQMTYFFSDRNQLVIENKRLLDELQNSKIDAVAYESVKYENQKLRETLQIKPVGDFKTVPIIAKSPQVPLDTLLLSEGVSAGIKEGDSVFAGERILIGKIVQVSGNTSIVSLNSLAGVVSYGYVARTNEPIEVNGGGGSLEAKVPIDFDINIEDKIISGGPANYIFAVVGAIEENLSSGFKKILISMPVDISKINFVFVKCIESCTF